MTKLMAQCVNRDNFFFSCVSQLLFFFFCPLRSCATATAETHTREKKKKHNKKKEEELSSCGGPSEPAVQLFSSIRRARSLQKVIFLTFLNDTAYISLFMHSME